MLEVKNATAKTANTQYSEFERQLENLINMHSLENLSNTSDFVLARFLRQCLEAYNEAVNARSKHSLEISVSSMIPSL